jgi:hypothetical protein
MVVMATSPRLINLGFGNSVVASRVVAIVSPDSAPMKRLKEAATSEGKLIDATQGRRTRSVVITDSDHVILCALQAETVGQRFLGDLSDEEDRDEREERELGERTRFLGEAESEARDRARSDRKPAAGGPKASDEPETR